MDDQRLAFDTGRPVRGISDSPRAHEQEANDQHHP
jgi:hypothetical protein